MEWEVNMKIGKRIYISALIVIILGYLKGFVFLNKSPFSVCSKRRIKRTEKFKEAQLRAKGKLLRINIARRKSGFLFQGAERMLLIREERISKLTQKFDGDFYRTF